MYSAFIRSGLEYGSVLYMGAAASHLQKLDRVQDLTQTLGDFQVESLGSRRESSCLSVACKLLAGLGGGSLSRFAPQVYMATARSRHQLNGLQIKMPVKPSKCPLQCFRRSFLSTMPHIWSLVPQHLITECQQVGWIKLPSKFKRYKNRYIYNCS